MKDSTCVHMHLHVKRKSIQLSGFCKAPSEQAGQLANQTVLLTQSPIISQQSSPSGCQECSCVGRCLPFHLHPGVTFDGNGECKGPLLSSSAYTPPTHPLFKSGHP